MALYNDGKGRYHNEYGKLCATLVRKSGKSKTRQGEVVRVIGRLGSEYYRNGNMNWGDDFETLAEWLRTMLVDSNVFTNAQETEINADIDQIIDNGQLGECPYIDEEDEYDRITDRVVEFCQYYVNPIPNETDLPF